MFSITRVYSDDNGDSHFEDVTIPLHSEGTIGYLSDALPAKEVFFREVDPSYDWNFHTAPTRQLIILLDGEIEITTSKNVSRKFRGGDVLLMEDTTGKGHKTKNIRPIKRKSIFIPLQQ